MTTLYNFSQNHHIQIKIDSTYESAFDMTKVLYLFFTRSVFRPRNGDALAQVFERRLGLGLPHRAQSITRFHQPVALIHIALSGSAYSASCLYQSVMISDRRDPWVYIAQSLRLGRLDATNKSCRTARHQGDLQGLACDSASRLFPKLAQSSSSDA
jgi:hypothetical protein